MRIGALQCNPSIGQISRYSDLDELVAPKGIDKRRVWITCHIYFFGRRVELIFVSALYRHLSRFGQKFN